MLMLKKLAHLALWNFIQFAGVIFHNEQSTSIVIYGANHISYYAKFVVFQPFSINVWHIVGLNKLAKIELKLQYLIIY